MSEKDIAKKVISNRFSGNGTHMSIANGLLERTGCDLKRCLVFANALVARSDESLAKELSVMEFSMLANSVLDSIPSTPGVVVGKIDSYEKLRAAGVKICDPKPEIFEEDRLPFSVRSQIEKVFVYNDFEPVNRAIKKIRKQRSASEGNLINLVESVNVAYTWLVNERGVKRVDLEKLVETVYEKNRKKYNWKS